MNIFTVEEINLVCIYKSNSRTTVIDEITAAYPFMESEFHVLAKRTIKKLNSLSDLEYSQLSFDPAT